jgi:hypothetical protein
MLEDLALPTAADEACVLEAATQLQHARSQHSEVSARVAANAAWLLRVAWRGEGPSDGVPGSPAAANPGAPVVTSQDGVRQLSELSIVPVLAPSLAGGEYHPGADSALVASAGAGSSMSTAPAVTAPSVLLVRYRDCVLPSDVHLVFTVLPVIPSELVPPRNVHTGLKIASPPALNPVLRHVKHITGVLQMGDTPSVLGGL